jgi:choline dehydrogenase
MPDPAGDFDYIIIGAGTAGCVLANRLSADPSKRVLLLEAGGNDRYVWIHIPVGYLYTMSNPRTDWCFMTESEPGLNGRVLNYPRGKVLGGCTAINGMIYMRGQARDYDHWRQLGNTGWGWDDVLPYFKRSEDHWRGKDEYHGMGGEWRVEPPRVDWEILDVFREAAAECSIPKVDDFNRGTNEGCGYFEVTQKAGVRWTAAKGFLRPARRRPNLLVQTEAQVKRLLIEDRRCTGVEFLHKGGVKTANARAEVILSGGSIGSPHILQLSGIGPGEWLRDHGIEVRHDLPGVGGNLQDHLQLRLIYKVKNTLTLNERARGLFGRAGMAWEYALFRRGPMTAAPSQLGCFARSDPSYDTPNLEYHVQPLSLDKFGEALHPFPAFTASVCNLRPTSRGFVRIKSPEPSTHPAIQLNYLSTDEDRRVAADAIRLTRRIAAADALKRFQPEEYRPGPDYQSDEELAKAAGEIGTTIFHPVGTCKMGPAEDALAVVDPELRVHGLEGLRIADASIMPTITSGNTSAPTVMIGEKAADLIRDGSRLERAA